MKATGLILLALLVGFVGYQFGYPKLDEWVRFPKVEEKSADPQPAQRVRVAKEEPKKEAPVVAEQPKVEPKMEEPKPEPPKKTEPEPVAKVEPPKKAANPDEFTPPDFPPIEDVVKNWTAIPKKAFPRQVKLMKDVDFVATIGNNKVATKVNAGGTVHALDQDGGKIMVALTPTSPAHVEVPLEDTDLKTVLTQAYDQWKPLMVEYLRKQWDYKHNHKAQVVVAANNKGPQRGDKPERGPDGTYPLLLASMKSGQVTEITPTNITKWSDAQLEKIEGKEYWTVVVNYTTKTMFGDFPTEAQARIFSGKVEKWVYTGSGEVVP